MSNEFKTCESVCPKCHLDFKFSPMHPLEPAVDCFLGGYICECEVTLMMDYEVASQSVVARELEDWRALKSLNKYKSIKVGTSSKDAALRAAARINKMSFDGRFTSYHVTGLGDGQYVVTLFVNDSKEIQDAHVSKVCTWKALLTRQEMETSNEH